MAIRIMLVDDHKVIRDGIKSYFDDDEAFEVTAEASDGGNALEKLQYGNVDVVLTDINMDGMDGVTLTKEISNTFPHVKVVAFSMLAEPHYIKQIMNNGGSGFLLKNAGEAEIKKALHLVEKGEAFYGEEVTRIIMENLAKRKKPKKSRWIQETPLTGREKEVLGLILKEYTNKEIAEELYISIRTVDAHKRNILEKTGSKNLAGLALYAVNMHLFEDI